MDFNGNRDTSLDDIYNFNGITQGASKNTKCSPMEMTCNLFDATSKSDNSTIEGYQVSSESSSRCHQASETVESSISKNIKGRVSSLLPSNPLGNLNIEFVSWNLGFKVKTTHEVLQKNSKDIVLEKPCPKSVDKNSANTDLRLNLAHSQTPGAMYKMRKIKRAFKESSNNPVLFPEPSEPLKKKQRFSFEHPNSEMKISSPEIKDSRQNRSLRPSSQKNSFGGSSKEGSLVSPRGKLSSHFKEPSENDQVATSTEVKSITQEAENENVLVASPQKHRRMDISKGPSEASEKQPNPDISQDYCSMTPRENLRGFNVSKTNHSHQVPSVMYDNESLQLLQKSALENSFLEAASKNYTVCMDRSDFILKEKFPISIVPLVGNCQLCQLQPQLLPPSRQSPNVSIMASNYKSQAHSIAQAGLMSPEKSKVGDKSISIVDESALVWERSFTSAERNKNILTKEAPLDLSVRRKMPADFRQEGSCADNSFVASVRPFSVVSLDKNNVLKSSPMNKTRRFYSPEKSKSSMDMSLANAGGTCSKSQADSDTNKSFKIQDINRVIKEETDWITNDVAELSNGPEDWRITSVAKRTLSASNAVEEASTEREGMDSLNIQNVDKDEVDTDFQAGVSSAEKQNAPGTGITKTISKKLQKPAITNYPEVECNHLVKERLNEIIKPVNEKVRIVKPKILPVTIRPVLQNNLNYFEEQLERAFASEGDRLKVKSLCECAATFELTWAALWYKCVMRVDVERTSASESRISFTPIGKNVVNRAVDSVFYDIQERGYKYFQSLVTDTRLPFPVFSTELIDKLSEYSEVAKDVETLMRDLLRVALQGISVISHELDPLKVTVQVINTNYECICNMTFCVDLKKYPREKIIPEVKHELRTDITKEVQMAAASVEPGRYYLYRIVNAALELAP